MLTAPLVYPFALLIAVVVGRRASTRRLPLGLVAARVLFVLYLGWIVGAVFFPIPLARPTGESGGLALDAGLLNHPNLTPLATIRETLALEGWPRTRLLGGNIVLFMPFGFLLPLIWPRFDRLGWMALAGLLYSLAIELGQLAVSLAVGSWIRMSDVDDVLLNVPGVLLGFGLYRLLAARRPAPS